MDLNDLKFEPAPPLKTPLEPVVPTKEAEVIEDDVCPTCHVPGSERDANGTCNVCGVTWDDDDEDDELMTALGLLYNCEMLFDKLLKNQRLIHKMSIAQEKELREVALSVSDFNETYEYADDDATGA